MIHPKFNADSCCQSCAAFVEYTNLKYPGDRRGTCHRHAPRPAPLSVKHYPPDGCDEPNPASSETGPDFTWPMVDDEFFCCEWIPKLEEPKP